MRKTVKLRRGLNLSILGGVADGAPSVGAAPGKVAITPDDFPGFIPKPDVKEGDAVVAGQALMHHKTAPEIRLTAPCAGTVEAIERGARRKILRIVVAAASQATHEAPFKASAATAAGVREALMATGLWAMMRQRPFDVIPDVDKTPRDIMVTALDTAPLAPDIEKGADPALAAAGVAALKLLTSGNIYIGVAEGSGMPDIAGAETVEFPRLHPAGNAGVQIANIAPVNKGETVWTLDITTLCRIGRLFKEGVVDYGTTVAVTGSEVKEPRYVKAPIGASLESLLKDNIKSDGVHHRIISGNILTGTPEGIDGYLRAPYRQVTVIPEGDDVDEFMGWASLSPAKMSESRSFPGRLFKKVFNPDARINGGRRAMIMSGVYDKTIPMDILPEYLIKAIIAKDIDKMEALGIYEVAPEDFALAEYADPSKLDLQKIVRDGLDYLRSEV